MLALAFVVAKAWADPSSGISLALLLACVGVFAAGQLLMVAAVGEYLGRLYLQYNGTPQYVVRAAGTRPTQRWSTLRLGRSTGGHSVARERRPSGRSH